MLLLLLTLALRLGSSAGDEVLFLFAALELLTLLELLCRALVRLAEFEAGGQAHLLVGLLGEVGVESDLLGCFRLSGSFGVRRSFNSLTCIGRESSGFFSRGRFDTGSPTFLLFLFGYGLTSLFVSKFCLASVLAPAVSGLFLMFSVMIVSRGKWKWEGVVCLRNASAIWMAISLNAAAATSTTATSSTTTAGITFRSCISQLGLLVPGIRCDHASQSIRVASYAIRRMASILVGGPAFAKSCTK
jgi:hypothetical protein